MAVLTKYGVTADPARVSDPDRKGTVENAIQHTQNTALKGRVFDSIDEQNKWLIHWEENWAAKRIHGRMKRQVEEMFQEEKPFLLPLPLTGFQYFRQETRKVSDDGTIQVGRSYYAALPAPLHQDVIVRIYDDKIEIIDPRIMEKIRTHPKSLRAGEVKMDPEDRIFNPSRQTDYLFSKAEGIGPNTRRLCELLFEEQGRVGQRRMQGIVSLARRYEACHIEQTAQEAIDMGLRSYKAFCRLVDIKKMKADQNKEATAGVVRQDHELIRPATDYGQFFDQYAATDDKHHDIEITKQKPIVPIKAKLENKPINIDLRPFLRPEQVKQGGVSKESCQYLGCGFLPMRPPDKAQSPLNGRIVFQVRGLLEEASTLKPIILSHIGRALTDHQEAADGKYWGFPFHKSLEIYNQDKLLMDPAATEQMKELGLILVKGFFDVAALVDAGCLNVGALMGAHITAEQIDRLRFINAHAPIPRITLFLDRDEGGRQGTKKAAALLAQNGFVVNAFDWDQLFTRPGLPPCRIGEHINDPGDLSLNQIKWLRKQGLI